MLRELYRGGNRMQLPAWLWQIVPMLARSGLEEEAAETGADQNTISHPTYKGCRTTRYSPGVWNASGV